MIDIAWLALIYEYEVNSKVWRRKLTIRGSEQSKFGFSVSIYDTFAVVGAFGAGPRFQDRGISFTLLTLCPSYSQEEEVLGRCMFITATSRPQE